MKRFDMRVSLVVCVVTMTLGAVAHAQTGMAPVMGMGASSCGRFIAVMGKNPPGKIQAMDDTGLGRFVSENSDYQQWLLGFVTGYNAARVGQQQVTGIDLAGMDLWMRNWCNQNPTKTVFEGANAFIIEMQSNAAAEPR
jgi:hypothetical protein